MFSVTYEESFYEITLQYKNKVSVSFHNYIIGYTFLLSLFVNTVKALSLLMSPLSDPFTLTSGHRYQAVAPHFRYDKDAILMSELV